MRFNVLAMSGRAVEAAGDVDTLLLDKTGTVTFGNRLPTEIIPVQGVTEKEAAEAALLASMPTRPPKAARSWRCAGEIRHPSQAGDGRRSSSNFPR